MSSIALQVQPVGSREGSGEQTPIVHAFQEDENAPVIEPNEPLTWAELCGGLKHRTGEQWAGTAFRICCVTFFIYFFLFSLDLMGASFKVIGGCSAGGLFNGISNPIAGLMIGILGTVLVQSSSTSTSVVVSLVGAGSMSVGTAVPVIMGANIGTSVTNTIVSMGQVNDVTQFKRAFAGATVHDMFNFLSVAVLLPIEMATGMLEHMTKLMVPDTVEEGESWEGPVKKLVDPLVKQLLVVNKDVTKNVAKGKWTCDQVYQAAAVGGEALAASLKTKGRTLIKCDDELGCPAFYHENATQDQDYAAGGVCLFLSLFLLCLCLAGLVKTLQSMVMGTSTRALRKATSMNPVVAIIVGACITILVQSSSITTSVLTPLVGLDIIQLDQMFPLTLGANIGTTATALLASLVSTKPEAVQIALCHLFFNIFGILIWFPIPKMRQVPMGLAQNMGEATARYRAFPLIYIMVAFVFVPGVLLGVSSLFDMGGPFLVLGIMATVGLLALLAWTVFWWKMRDGKKIILAFADDRQKRRELNANLPTIIKQLQQENEQNKAEIAKLTAV